MLGLYDFKVLSFENQANQVWDNGLYLGVRVEKQYRINLYGLGDFYVEVYYDSKTNKIVRFRTFKSAACLEPYLNDIELDLGSDGKI